MEHPICHVGIIGDVHGEDEFLAAALEFLRQAHVDALFCTGDVMTGPGDVNRCCRLLKEAKVLTVRGNHERWFFGGAFRDLRHATQLEDVDAGTLAFLKSLPATLTFKTKSGPLMLCHGLGDNDMAGVYPDNYGFAHVPNHLLEAFMTESNYRFIVNGHTHQRLVRTFQNLTVLNAGTLRRDHGPCFLIADFEAGRAQFYDIDQNAHISRSAVYRFPA